MTTIYKSISHARGEVIGAARVVVEAAQDGNEETVSYAMSVLAIAFEKLDGLRAIARDYEAEIDAVEKAVAHG
jgi:hypothetical protein